MTARLIERLDVEEVMRMRKLLFPDCEIDQHWSELERYFRPVAEPGTVGNQVCFVTDRPDGTGLAGFAEAMLRSHAEGAWEHTADGSMGIAYLEAWFVDDASRGAGVGRQLMAACEGWAREQGSPVLASDALIENARSIAAHAALGFEEVERSVHFIKKLE